MSWGVMTHATSCLRIRPSRDSTPGWRSRTARRSSRTWGREMGPMSTGRKLARRQVASGDAIVVGKFTVTIEGLAASTQGPAPPQPAPDSGGATILTSLDASKIGRAQDIKEGDVDARGRHRAALEPLRARPELCGRLGTCRYREYFPRHAAPRFREGRPLGGAAGGPGHPQSWCP